MQRDHGPSKQCAQGNAGPSAMFSVQGDGCTSQNPVELFKIKNMKDVQLTTQKCNTTLLKNETQCSFTHPCAPLSTKLILTTEQHGIAKTVD